MTLTIAYCTARKGSHIGWFFDSLNRLILEEWPDVLSMLKIVVVDFHMGLLSQRFLSELTTQVRPKPSVWQGEHRLTKENWFAMANTRNTALCYAPDGWIAYVDDLSVLMPGWLLAVKQSIEQNAISLGSYMKCKNLVVEDGRAVSYNLHQLDTRWHNTGGPDMISCGGDWMYGCSLVAPVQAFLDINGWGECLCDGLGFEDVCTGIVLGNTNRYSFRYDRNMLTLESEEDHHKEPAFRKEDWHWEGGRPVCGGNGGDDKSHSALNQAKSSKKFEQHFGGEFGDIATLRQHILNGGQFPIQGNPCHDWYTKLALKDL